MVDVDGQEAAGIVTGVERRRLLVAVHRVAGVVDNKRDRHARESIDLSLSTLTDQVGA